MYKQSLVKMEYIKQRGDQDDHLIGAKKFETFMKKGCEAPKRVLTDWDKMPGEKIYDEDRKA